jgi:glycosyltransferase involved in cell wall biosynthesis
VARICLDISPLWTPSRFRGIGRYVRGLVGALQRGLLRPPDGRLEIMVLAGAGPSFVVQPIDHPLPAERDPPGPPMPYQVYYALKRALLPPRLARAGVDLFHAADPKGTPRMARTATVVTCHDLIPTILGGAYLPFFWPRVAHAQVDRLRYRRHDHVIAVSSHTRGDLQRVTGLPDRQVTVVHHGIDHESFSPDPAPGDEEWVRRLVGSERPYFVYVGGFDARKQVSLLVEALGRCAGRIDEALVICGRAGASERAALERLVGALGLGRRVTFADFVPVPGLPALYRRATAHVLASSYEGFGFTVLEAMACGCPVLALRTSSLPEVTGQAALLVPSGSPDAIAAAMVGLVADERQRRLLRERGLERVRAFSWERCARETLSVLCRVLDERRAGAAPS